MTKLNLEIQTDFDKLVLHKFTIIVNADKDLNHK